MTDSLAENLVDHRDRGLAMHVITKLGPDHHSSPKKFKLRQCRGGLNDRDRISGRGCATPGEDGAPLSAQVPTEYLKC